MVNSSEKITLSIHNKLVKSDQLWNIFGKSLNLKVLGQPSIVRNIPVKSQNGIYLDKALRAIKLETKFGDVVFNLRWLKWENLFMHGFIEFIVRSQKNYANFEKNYNSHKA